MVKGDRIVITAEGTLGALDPQNTYRFHPDVTATAGDNGVYIGPHETLPNWIMVAIERDGAEYLVPLGAEQIRPA